MVQPSFNEYCRPLTTVWNHHAEKVHKISKPFAAQQQHPKELHDKLIEFIKPYDTIFTPAGWNINGDKMYLERLMSDYGGSKNWYRRTRQWRDVKVRMQERKKHFPVTNYKLGTCAKFFDIEINAHDALSDADATMQVDNRLSTVNMMDIATQLQTQGLDNVSKREKYTDKKYLQIGHDTVYLSEHATKNPEAMRFIITELWDVFVEGR